MYILNITDTVINIIIFLQLYNIPAKSFKRVYAEVAGK